MKTVRLFLFGVVFIASCGDNPNPNEAISLEATCRKMLVKTLLDPGSYQPIDWTHYTNDSQSYADLKKKYPDYNYKFFNRVFIHRYRAKNAFGAYNIGAIYFLLDSKDSIEMTESLPSYLNLR